METHQQYALALVPVLAFAESCIGIGIFVSGAFLVAVATFVLSTDIASLEIIGILAAAGAIVGDHVGFYAGRILGPRFHTSAVAHRYRISIDRGEALIRKQGTFAIVIGRFIPAIRSIIPALIGLSEFKPAKYSAYDICACIAWALALMAIVSGVSSLI